MAGLGAVVASELGIGLPGFGGFERDGLLPVATGARAEPETQDEILGAVFNHEARRPGRENVCIRLAPEGRAFESEKVRIGTLIRNLSQRPGERQQIVAELDSRRNPRRRWLQGTDPLAGEPRPLGEENARQLRVAETTLLDGPSAGGVDLLLDMARVPAAFRSEASGCNPLLFTAPAIAGDLAFVETTFNGRPDSPEYWLYAVIRRDGRWQVEAVAPNG